MQSKLDKMTEASLKTRRANQHRRRILVKQLRDSEKTVAEMVEVLNVTKLTIYSDLKAIDANEANYNIGS